MEEADVSGDVQTGTCHVVAAGPSGGSPPSLSEGDFLIAVDAGLDVCRASGLAVDLAVGDFDSLSGPAPRSSDFTCGDATGRVVTLPTAKDDTDTLAALREGLMRGYRDFHVYAALGGDVGHTLANLQALLFLRNSGAWGVLEGGGQTVALVVPADGLCTFETSRGMRVSTFAFAGRATGVSEHGFSWDLDDAVLEADFPIGCSNRALGDEVAVGVEEGCVAVVLG